MKLASMNLDADARCAGFQDLPVIAGLGVISFLWRQSDFPKHSGSLRSSERSRSPLGRRARSVRLQSPPRGPPDRALTRAGVSMGATSPPKRSRARPAGAGGRGVRISLGGPATRSRLTGTRLRVWKDQSSGTRCYCWTCNTHGVTLLCGPTEPSRTHSLTRQLRQRTRPAQGSTWHLGQGPIQPTPPRPHGTPARS